MQEILDPGIDTVSVDFPDFVCDHPSHDREAVYCIVWSCGCAYLYCIPCHDWAIATDKSKSFISCKTIIGGCGARFITISRIEKLRG